MTDQNSVASVNPTTQAGLNSWTINGQQEITQQWFWYSLGPVGGGTAPASLDTLALIGDTQPTANTLNLTYGGAGFTIGVDYTLTGTAVGTYKSDIGESISIQNTSASPLSLEFYKYQDFNLQDGGGGPNTVNIYGNPNGYNTAIQTSATMTAMSDVVNAPSSQEAEAFPTFVTLNRLNNGTSPVVLASGAPYNTITAGPGSVTSAFEWDFNIGAGQTALISEDDLVESTSMMIPEPSTWALMSSALGALFLWQKRRARA